MNSDPERRISSKLDPRAAFPLTITFLISLFFLPAVSWSYTVDEDTITAEFWTELDPIVDLDHSGVITQNEAIRRTLEEARIVLSGMIYGFEVRYVPSDIARNVSEELSVTPRALIPAGDRALRVLDVRIHENKYFVHVRYNLADHQIQRMQALQSNTLESIGGRGSTPLYGGYRAKFESFDQAIKNTLREYLRPRIKNKPRQIDARVVFAAPPYTTIDAGGYHSSVRIKVDLREVRPYSAY